MIKKILLFFHTLIHLKPKQIYYRVYYLIRKYFIYQVNSETQFEIKIDNIKWSNIIYNNLSYSKKKFTFLNISHEFSNEINWNLDIHGKLWTYNLNYFDFLNQKDGNIDKNLSLIYEYIKKDKVLKDGKEPYPISLRGVNWVKFLSINKINNPDINKFLFSHYQILLKNIEYSLLGNHLLENAFSLLFGSYFFKDEKLYLKAKEILYAELDEQILNDGAHFELSPMYHQVIFSRVLDSIHLINLNKTWKKDKLKLFLKKKANLMYSWLDNITYENGDIPMVNDSTYDIAPNSMSLFKFANLLGIKNINIPLSDSGYRKIKFKKNELFIDVGNIGPDYQPGHAHSDTFNFEYIRKRNPIIVDTGISTYENNKTRKKQRGTISHNTVKYKEYDQSEVWSSFRVARRAKILNLKEKKKSISAIHNGYKKYGIEHYRSFEWGDNLIITDQINKKTKTALKAFFHLHSSIKKPIVNKSIVTLYPYNIKIIFENAKNILIDSYEVSEGFNKTKLAYKIIVCFNEILKTKIL